MGLGGCRGHPSAQLWLWPLPSEETQSQWSWKIRHEQKMGSSLDGEATGGELVPRVASAPSRIKGDLRSLFSSSSSSPLTP